MSVNGVTTNSVSDAYSNSYNSTAKKTKSADKASTTTNNGVIYEASAESTSTSTKKTYTPNTELIQKMKADAESRSSQFQSIVTQMLSKQGNAYGNANSIWSVLSSGNFTVDPATKAQAQADISENGYWGVSQTSSRILDFATALTGGDPDKIEEMRAAFEKGYKKAEKIWGGNLPEISQKTYDAVLAGFDKMAQDAGIQE